MAALARLLTARGRWNFVAGMSQFLRADGQVPAMASCLVRSGPQTQRPSTSVFRRPGHEGRMPLPPRPSSARPDEGMRIAGQKQCGQVLTGWEMSREGSFTVLNCSPAFLKMHRRVACRFSCWPCPHLIAAPRVVDVSFSRLRTFRPAGFPTRN